MPELPEVETMRRGLEGLVGRRIAAVAFPRGRVRPLSAVPRPVTIVRRIEGRSIAAVGRRGKRLVIELAGRGRDDSPLWLVIEPRMTGLALVADPPTDDHVRLVVDLVPMAGRSAVNRFLFWDRRGLGTIRLFDDRGLEAACGRKKLGPDGLAVTAAELADRLGRSRRGVKVALLDQRAVAGIGNIYAAEILFRAGIDPRTPCRGIRRVGWERIAAEARTVLAEAVRHEGSSLGDDTYRTADNRFGRFQLRHRVYGREGRPCTACRTAIMRIVQAQRATFFCPACQRRPGRATAAGRGVASPSRTP
jgi:formamidopyrimidine-DNA glycosylase